MRSLLFFSYIGIMLLNNACFGYVTDTTDYRTVYHQAIQSLPEDHRELCFQLKINDFDTIYQLCNDTVDGDLIISDLLSKNNVEISNVVVHGSIIFKDCSIKQGVLINQVKAEKLVIEEISAGWIFLSQCQISDSVRIFDIIPNDVTIRFNDCIFRSNVLISGFGIKQFFMESCRFEEDLKIINAWVSGYSTIRDSWFHRTNSRLVMAMVFLEGELRFDATTLPMKLIFYDVKPRKDVDLTNAKYKSSTRGTIQISSPSPERFQVPFDKIEFAFDDRDKQTIDDKLRVYQDMLSYYELHGMDHVYKHLDIQYQKFYHNSEPFPFSSTVYWIKRIWWNFGHDKWLILINITILVLIFTSINFLRLKPLIQNVYPIEGIKKRLPTSINESISPALKWSTRLNLAFYYTVILFFGLKLDVSKLSFEKPRWLLYIFSIYVTGIVATAFLINWILKF